MKLLAAAAGLVLVASSPVLTAALVPAVDLVIVAEVAYVAYRLRRNPNPRRNRIAYGA